MKHNCKEMNKLLRKATQLGCRIEMTKKGAVKVFPPIHLNLGFRTVHVGERGLHPLRRYVRDVQLALDN